MREFLIAVDKFTAYIAEQQVAPQWTNIVIGEHIRETLTSSYASGSSPSINVVVATMTLQESVA